MSINFALMLATGLAIIILLLYIIGRMGKLEEVTRSLLQSKNESSKESGSGKVTNTSVDSDDLQGKELWDALTGRNSDIKAENIDSVRQRYEIILKKHVQTLLQAGYSDSQSGGIKKNPGNSDSINTLRGSVQSWLPSEHCAVLYNSGYELATTDEKSEQDRLRMSIDDSIAALFDQVKLPFPGDFSQGLISAIVK
tara:strand:+ start:6423 stop:7010 length:588 start_codon:yes stop_codon:yes gene_type:complete